MKWILFSEQAFNFDDFCRIYTEGRFLFAIAKSGRKIVIREYESNHDARNGLGQLYAVIEKAEKERRNNGLRTTEEYNPS